MYLISDSCHYFLFICQLQAGARAFKKFLPLFDRILVERSVPEVRTKGGIMIPEKAQGKTQEAMVVATGGGIKNEVRMSFS